VARLKVLTGQAQFGLTLRASITLAALLVLSVSVVSGMGTRAVAPALFAVVTITVARNHLRRLLEWRVLLGLTVLVILFIPIRRYTLPASLPFQLEPYRLIVAAVAVAWLTSLLIDPRVRLRAAGLEGPIFLFVGAIFGSLLANHARVNETSPFVIKGVSFFLSYVLVYLLVVSLVRSTAAIDFLGWLLAGGGAAVALFVIIEARTGFNLFNHIRAVAPVLHWNSEKVFSLSRLHRGGHPRAYGSAQHPIAMGVTLAMLLPFAVYRATAYAQRRWWIASALLVFGLLATRSRTAILMLLAIALVFVLLRPQQMRRLWPVLLPALIAIHFALPGAIGTVRGSFFPKGGLIAQQTNQSVGHGRLATLGPALHDEFRPNPILGEGFSTRVTSPEPDFPVPNAPITDNGWLQILLETGVVGTLALFWVFVRTLRRTGKEAKVDSSPRGWFLVAACASIGAYGVGMFTYDAFSFIQSTFLLFIVLGLGMAALRTDPSDWRSPVAAP
jgi:O-antigen ligase